MASKSNEYNGEYISYSPEIIPVDSENYQNEFLYGKSIEKLNSKQIKSSSSGGNIKIGHFTINATGSKVITGLGFTPKNLEILSTVTSTNGVLESKGFTDGTNTYLHMISTVALNSTRSYYGGGGNIVSIEDITNYTYASFSSFDADGFTLNVSDKLVNVECTYIAFG